MLHLLVAFGGVRPSAGQKTGILGVVCFHHEYYLEWRDADTIGPDEIGPYSACAGLVAEGSDASPHQRQRPFVITSMHNAIAFSCIASVTGDDLSSTVVVALKDGPPKLFHTSPSSAPSEIVQAMGMVVEGCDVEPTKNGVASLKMTLDRSSSTTTSPRSFLSLGGLRGEGWRGAVLEQFARVTTFYSDAAQRILGIRQSRTDRSDGEYVENPWIEKRAACLPKPRFSPDRHIDGAVVGRFVDESGRVANYPNLCLLVHCGAVKDFATRWEVWLYLLRVKSPDMTSAQFTEHCAALQAEYKGKAAEGAALSEETLSRIKKDVVRTDRLVFHPRDDGNELDQPSLQLMERVLVAYVATDPELDYVQGMNDFLSPIMYVAMQSVGLGPDTEHLVFWMFHRLMSLVRDNFEHCSESIERQLETLKEMVWEVDPLYHDYFSLHHDSLQLYFTYRWILLWFKREVSYQGVFPLWDTILSADRLHQYVLCVALAMLLKERGFLVHNSRRFDEILAHFNAMAGSWSIDSVLSLASQLELWFATNKRHKQSDL